MKYLLRAFRNFFIIFAIFVVLAMVLSNSEKARKFVTPGTVAIPPEFDIPKGAINNTDDDNAGGNNIGNNFASDSSPE